MDLHEAIRRAAGHFVAVFARARAGRSWPIELVEVAPDYGRGWRLGFEMGGKVPLHVYAARRQAADVPVSRNFAYAYGWPGGRSVPPALERAALALCRALARFDLEPAPAGLIEPPVEPSPQASRFEVDLAARRGDRESVQIELPGACGRACLFCEAQFQRVADPGHRSPRDGHELRTLANPQQHHRYRQRVFDELDRLAVDRPDAIVAWGGIDCLSSPIFPDALQRAHALGFRDMWIISPGTRLAMPGFAAWLADTGVTHVSVTAHAASPELNDHIVGLPGAHRLLRRGLDLMAKEPLSVGVRVPLLRQNLHELPSLVLEMSQRRVTLELFFWYPRPEPFEKYFEDMAPRFSEVEQALWAAHERGVDLARLPMVGVPSCALSPRLRQLLPHRFAEPGGEMDGHIAQVRVGACEACRLRGECRGLPRLVRDAYGEAGLSPVGDHEQLGTGARRDHGPERPAVVRFGRGSKAGPERPV